MSVTVGQEPVAPTMAQQRWIELRFYEAAGLKNSRLGPILERGEMDINMRVTLRKPGVALYVLETTPRKYTSSCDWGGEVLKFDYLDTTFFGPDFELGVEIFHNMRWAGPDLVSEVGRFEIVVPEATVPPTAYAVHTPDDQEIAGALHMSVTIGPEPMALNAGSIQTPATAQNLPNFQNVELELVRGSSAMPQQQRIEFRFYEAAGLENARTFGRGEMNLSVRVVLQKPGLNNYTSDHTKRRKYKSGCTWEGELVIIDLNPAISDFSDIKLLVVIIHNRDRGENAIVLRFRSLKLQVLLRLTRFSTNRFIVWRTVFNPYASKTSMICITELCNSGIFSFYLVFLIAIQQQWYTTRSAVLIVAN